MEIFGLNTYGFHEDNVKGKAVLDIGAHIGFFSLLAVASGARMVLAVEPNVRNFERLKANTAMIRQVIPMNMAVHDGRADLCRTFEDDTTSKVAFDGELGVEARSLDQFTSMMPPGDDLVLKIDAEGSEFDIIVPAPISALRRYRLVFMEIHGTGDGPRSIKFIKDYMAFAGFAVAYTFPVFWWTWDDAGNVLDCKKIDIEVVKFVRIDES